MKDSEAVAAARELISDPDAWIRGDWCVGEPGQVQMCAEGAVRLALGLMVWHEAEGSPTLTPAYWERLGHTTQSIRIEARLAATAREALPNVFEDIRAGYERSGYGPFKPEQVVLSAVNDTHVTEHKDILDIFDKTHAQLLEEGN